VRDAPTGLAEIRILRGDPDGASRSASQRDLELQTRRRLFGESEHEKGDKVRKNGLVRASFGLGFFSMIFGILIILTGLLLLWPKAKNIETALEQSLRSADATISVAQQNVGILNSALSLAEISSKFIALISETLITLNGTLVQAATALQSTGSTLDSLEEGIAGIALPSQKVGQNVSNATKLADQLTLLAGMVQEMREASAGLSTPNAAFSERVNALNSSLPAMWSNLKDLQLLVTEVRSFADRFPISLLLLSIPFVIGGIFSLLGLLLISSASMHRSSESLSSSSWGGQSSRARKAA